MIFDEAYEGNDVDAFYLGDILRALGCTLTNKSVVELGGATELGKSQETDDCLMNWLQKSFFFFFGWGFDGKLCKMGQNKK